MKNYLTSLETKLTNRDLPIIATAVNFLEKDSTFDDLYNSETLETISKYMHHEYGFQRFISNMKVDVSPSKYLNYIYDKALDYTEIYYTFTENLLKTYHLINENDSIKNFDPPFFSDMNKELEYTSSDKIDCRFLLNEDSYYSFLKSANNELHNKNYINIPGIGNKTSINNITKNIQTNSTQSPWVGPKVDINPSVKYVMKEEYSGKSITYLLLLAIYNYINNISLPNYVEVISECAFKTPEKDSSNVWWINSPNIFLNNFQKSSNSLYLDTIERFGYDVFEDYKTNEELVPRNLRTIFILRIPYESIRTIENCDINISKNQIINMNPCKPSISNFKKKTNYIT